MKKLVKLGTMMLIAMSLTLGVPMAFAKVHGGGARTNPAGHTPAGWSHGKKTGWRGANTPPGLANKANHHKHHKKEKKTAEENTGKGTKE